MKRLTWILSILVVLVYVTTTESAVDPRITEAIRTSLAGYAKPGSLQAKTFATLTDQQIGAGLAGMSQKEATRLLHKNKIGLNPARIKNILRWRQIAYAHSG